MSSRHYRSLRKGSPSEKKLSRTDVYLQKIREQSDGWVTMRVFRGKLLRAWKRWRRRSRMRRDYGVPRFNVPFARYVGRYRLRTAPCSAVAIRRFASSSKVALKFPLIPRIRPGRKGRQELQFHSFLSHLQLSKNYAQVPSIIRLFVTEFAISFGDHIFWIIWMKKDTLMFNGNIRETVFDNIRETYWETKMKMNLILHLQYACTRVTYEKKNRRLKTRITCTI